MRANLQFSPSASGTYYNIGSVRSKNNKQYKINKLLGEDRSGNPEIIGYQVAVEANAMEYNLDFFVFTVSGITDAPIVGDIYENNSSGFQIIEVNLTGGAGTLACIRYSGTNDPLASGNLGVVIGDGDAIIAFSSWLDNYFLSKGTWYFRLYFPAESKKIALGSRNYFLDHDSFINRNKIVIHLINLSFMIDKDDYSDYAIPVSA